MPSSRGCSGQRRARRGFNQRSSATGRSREGAQPTNVLNVTQGSESNQGNQGNQGNQVASARAGGDKDLIHEALRPGAGVRGQRPRIDAGLCFRLAVVCHLLSCAVDGGSWLLLLLLLVCCCVWCSVACLVLLWLLLLLLAVAACWWCWCPLVVPVSDV